MVLFMINGEMWCRKWSKIALGPLSKIHHNNVLKVYIYIYMYIEGKRTIHTPSFLKTDNVYSHFGSSANHCAYTFVKCLSLYRRYSYHMEYRYIVAFFLVINSKKPKLPDLKSDRLWVEQFYFGSHQFEQFLAFLN